MKPLFLREQDYAELSTIHPVLAAVVIRTAAIWAQHEGTVFRVTDGLRTAEEQARYFEKGLSRVRESLHQRGLACDLALLNPQRTIALWEWPRYQRLNATVQTAAAEFGVVVEWGGNWVNLRDGVHWQLSGFAPVA